LPGRYVVYLPTLDHVGVSKRIGSDKERGRLRETIESMKPHTAFAVDNKLSEDANAGQLKVDLNFKSMEDFEPEQVARQVRPLRELLDLRTKLSDLRGALQTNEKLDTVLMEAIGNTEKMNKIKEELSKEKEKGGSNEPA